MEAIPEETLTPPQEILTPPSISDEENLEYVRIRTVWRKKIVEVEEKFLVLRDNLESDGLLYSREESNERFEHLTTQDKKMSLDQFLYECKSVPKDFSPALPTLASHLTAKLFAKRRAPASKSSFQPGAKKKPKVVDDDSEKSKNQIESVQNSVQNLRLQNEAREDDESLTELIARREQQVELEKVKSEPVDEENDQTVDHSQANEHMEHSTTRQTRKSKRKVTIQEYIDGNFPAIEDEDAQSCFSSNLQKPVSSHNIQSYCDDVKQERDEETDSAVIPAMPTFSNQNSNGTDYNFFGSSSSLQQSSPSSRSMSSSCDGMVDLSIGSLVWARFVGDEENEPGLTFYYPALIKHILDNRSDKVKVTYLDEEFMKTVAIKKSHVLLLSEDRIRKSDIRFCRRQSVDQWIPTKIINLWGRRKPDVDSKSTMCMATKWSGYECRDSIDDTVRLVRMTDCAILVDENIIKEYAIRMPDNPVTSYELNFNSLTPRARKTSAVDTLLDKFPFYRHVFHFTPSTLAENYRVQIEHVMGGEVCDKLEVNEHDFSKKIICIAEDKGRTLNRYGSSAAFCLASDIPIVTTEWLEKCLRTRKKRTLGKRDFIFEPNLEKLSMIFKGYLIKFCMHPKHYEKMRRIAIRLGAICTDKNVSDQAIDTYVDFVAIHYDKKHSSKVHGASNVTLNWFISCIEQKRRINIDSRYLIQVPEIKNDPR
ncbi:unnamed protein product [Oikopleura dioica]|uniref:BRCT domain-containing protein n=1 Tax=Oikopleura dioica TaxID=34765 RepID=E4YYN8_OIKDI|nr:unnamed protein product [Oikopleura dioica]